MSPLGSVRGVLEIHKEQMLSPSTILDRGSEHNVQKQRIDVQFASEITLAVVNQKLEPESSKTLPTSDIPSLLILRVHFLLCSLLGFSIPFNATRTPRR